MPDLSPESIAEAATQPASATQDGRSATAVPIDQQKSADMYRKNAAALDGTTADGGQRSGWRGLRIARVRGSSTNE